MPPLRLTSRPFRWVTRLTVNFLSPTARRPHGGNRWSYYFLNGILGPRSSQSCLPRSSLSCGSHQGMLRFLFQRTSLLKRLLLPWELLDVWSEMVTRGRALSVSPSVKVLTWHNAQDLEFPLVVVLMPVGQPLPVDRSDVQINKIRRVAALWRRTAYLAMTHLLYLRRLRGQGRFVPGVRRSNDRGLCGERTLLRGISEGRCWRPEAHGGAPGRVNPKGLSAAYTAACMRCRKNRAILLSDSCASGSSNHSCQTCHMPG